MFLQSWSAEKKSIVATLAITTGLVILGIVSFRKVWPNQSNGWMIWLGFAAGGVGGLIHEFAQSGGRLLLTKREADGIYLGALMGMLLGILAGVLAVQSLFVQPSTSSNTPPSPPSMSAGSTTATQPGNTQPAAPTSPIAIQALYTALLAGLSLKGVAEAATGQSVSGGAGTLPAGTPPAGTPPAGTLPTGTHPANARVPGDLPANPNRSS